MSIVAKSDTSISKISTTDILTSQKINAKNIKVQGLIINGNTNKIYSTNNNISFNNTNLNDVGTLNANTVHADNLLVDYTSFDSLRVYNKIKIGTNSLTIGPNSYAGCDEIISDAGKINLVGTPDATDIKVGIGTEAPLKNLHIKGTTCTNCPVIGPKSTTLRIEDQLIDQAGNLGNSSYWDVAVSGAAPNNKLFFQSSNATNPNDAILTITQNRKVGINKEIPEATLDINGNFKLLNGSIINEFSTDVTLAGNSDEAIPTEQAVKTYVDSHSSNTLQDADEDTRIEVEKTTDDDIIHFTTKDLEVMNMYKNNYDDNLNTIVNGRLKVNTNYIDDWGFALVSNVMRDNTKAFVIAKDDVGKVIIYGDGRTGIGTTSPYRKLEVSTDDSNVQLRLVKTNGSEGFTDIGTDNTGFYICPNGFTANKPFLINTAGNVGIGLTGTDVPQYKLDVRGTAHFCKAIAEANGWCDYVFDINYNLTPLDSLALYVKANKHLPGIPTTDEVEENGIDLGEMNAKLLQKVEELTLYVISLQKQLNKQQNEIEVLKQTKN